MDAQNVEFYRRKLLSRSESLLQRRKRTLANEQALLEEREADWEDVAANRTDAARLEALVVADAAALERIRASLERLDLGTFGDCVICHGAIETERLRAMPDVERCSGCSR